MKFYPSLPSIINLTKHTKLLSCCSGVLFDKRTWFLFNGQPSKLGLLLLPPPIGFVLVIVFETFPPLLLLLEIFCNKIVVEFIPCTRFTVCGFPAKEAAVFCGRHILLLLLLLVGRIFWLLLLFKIDDVDDNIFVLFAGIAFTSPLLRDGIPVYNF